MGRFNGVFVKAYPAETTEAFLDGHVAAIVWLGREPQSVLYDNTKIAVAKILGATRRFSSLLGVSPMEFLSTKLPLCLRNPARLDPPKGRVLISGEQVSRAKCSPSRSPRRKKQKSRLVRVG